MNEACHTYDKWVTVHMSAGHVARMDESCDIMSHIWMSHATHVNESCNRYEVMFFASHVLCISKGHAKYSTPTTLQGDMRSCPLQLMSFASPVLRISAAHMRESCHTCKYGRSNIWKRDCAQVTESCGIYEWVMSCMWPVALHSCILHASLNAKKLMESRGDLGHDSLNDLGHDS